MNDEFKKALTHVVSASNDLAVAIQSLKQCLGEKEQDTLLGKVLAGLICCTKEDEFGYPQCERCPYADVAGTCTTMRGLTEDALTVIKYLIAKE